MKREGILILLCLIFQSCDDDKIIIDEIPQIVNDSVAQSSGNRKKESEDKESWAVNNHQRIMTCCEGVQFPLKGEKWKGGKTAKDYFLNVPGQLVTYPGFDYSKFDRQRRLKVLRADSNDRASFYLQPGEIYPVSGGTYFALFVSPETEPVLAVFHYLCGPGCEINYGFLKYSDEKWMNVSDEVFNLDEIWPYRSFKKEFGRSGLPPIRFVLRPSENKIEVINDEEFSMTGTGKKLKEMIYENGKFSIRK